MAEAQRQQEQLEADVTDALNRGVCALSSEAMAVIRRRAPEGEVNIQSPLKGQRGGVGFLAPPRSPKVAAAAPVRLASSPNAPHSRLVPTAVGAIAPPPCFVEHSPPATHVTPGTTRHTRHPAPPTA